MGPKKKGAAATSGRGSAKDGRATKKGKGAEQGAKGKVQKTSKKSTKDKRSVQPAATLSLPVARIRRIMKDSDDIHSIGPDAVHVIGKAVELFINQFAKKACEQAESDDRRNITYKDLATTVSAIDNLYFLEEIIPQRVTVEEAYKLIEEAQGTNPGEQAAQSEEAEEEDEDEMEEE